MPYQLEFAQWSKLTSLGHLEWTIANGSLSQVNQAMENHLANHPDHRNFEPGRASYDDWWIASETAGLEDMVKLGESTPVESLTEEPQSDDREELAGLGLMPTPYAIATRRLEWDTWSHKANVMAARLGVPGDELGKYVSSLVSRAPALNNNKWDYRDELEQSIWYRLTRYSDSCRGNWDKVKGIASDAYKIWYRKHAQEHTANKELQSISLDRADFRDGLDNGRVDDCVMHWESEIDGKYSVKAMVDSLPGLVRDVVQKRLMGVPTTPVERKRLSRFLATNTGNVLEMLATGDLQSDWNKSTRK